MTNRLLPACLNVVDARTLADRYIADLGPDPDAALLAKLTEQAECSSHLIAPPVFNPSPYQQLWKLRFFTETLELPTVRIIEQLLARYSTLFIDVGAHVGYFSILAARMGAERIVAIEMHEPNFNILRVNVPRATAVRVGVGREAREMEYFIGTGHSNHSLHHRGDVSDTKCAVRIDTLDAVVGEYLAAPFVVKIDVQGHEYEVLLGFDRGLSSKRAIVVFEVERAAPGQPIEACYISAISHLFSAGYKLFSIGDNSLSSIGGEVAELDGLPLSSNMIAVPQDIIDEFLQAIFRRTHHLDI